MIYEVLKLLWAVFAYQGTLLRFPVNASYLQSVHETLTVSDLDVGLNTAFISNSLIFSLLI